MTDSQVDLLVFGRTPMTLKSDSAGAVALHTAMGLRVGMCDLTRGELGSNGTPEEREAEADKAREVLGATWRMNLRWPDGGITGTDDQILDVVRLIRSGRPRTVALPYWNDRHPDHRAASDVLARAAFKSGLRRFASDAGEPWRPDWICYYFINDSAPRVVRHRRLRELRDETARARLSPIAVHHGCTSQRVYKAHRPALSANDRKPRCASRCAAWCGIRGGRCRPRTSPAASLDEELERPAGRASMNIGIVCYASVGGSGSLRPSWPSRWPNVVTRFTC
jgi:LmbE family N-acetylglucosaminyl deacetylase